MDVFGLRDRTIGEYRGCVTGFLRIGDARVYQDAKEPLDIMADW